MKYRLNKSDKQCVLFSWIAVFILLTSIQFGWATSSTTPQLMQSDTQKIESLRSTHDDSIMAIPGVVSVATGLSKNGKPCIKIGTSVPTKQVEPLLPEELSKENVELEYLGDIKAQ